MSNYIEIKSGQQLDEELKNIQTPYVLYFTATWCGPCRAIAPVFVKLAQSNPSIRFIKIDIDLLQDHVQVQTISSVPKFEFYKGGVKVSEFAGASASSLEKNLASLA